MRHRRGGRSAPFACDACASVRQSALARPLYAALPGQAALHISSGLAPARRVSRNKASQKARRLAAGPTGTGDGESECRWSAESGRVYEPRRSPQLHGNSLGGDTLLRWNMTSTGYQRLWGQLIEPPRGPLSLNEDMGCCFYTKAPLPSKNSCTRENLLAQSCSEAFMPFVC